MRIDILTLFPQMFDSVLQESILGRAIEKGLVEVQTLNFRSFARNKHQHVDDTPYGGGGGMVLQAEPLFLAVEDLCQASVQQDFTSRPPRVILLCPQGEPYTQEKAWELAKEEHLILLCGHYEGFDERIRTHLATDEISIGDYVLTGGELPAMILLDSVVRLLPGVLGNELSAAQDSYNQGLLEHPHYTRPVDFRGWKVPDVLLSGNHREIERWRKKEALRRTAQRRPDLLQRLVLNEEERQLLCEIRQEAEEDS